MGLGDNGSLNSGFVGIGIVNSIYGLNVGFNDCWLGLVNIIKLVLINVYGVEMFWWAVDWVIINGFGIYFDGKLIGKGDFEIWIYGVIIVFFDLLKEGSLGGIVVGWEFYLNDLEFFNGLDLGLW